MKQIKNDNQQLRYIEYCRKSSDAEDRQVQSIPDQQRELKPLINDRGLNIVRPFGESRSAKKPGRPDFNEMIRMIEAGEADAILCWRPNRLARNPVDGGTLLWLLQQGKLKAITTPSKDYLPTDNTIPLAVEFAMASQFSIDLGKDVARGLRGKVDKGWRPFQAPLGYLNDPHSDKGEKKIFTDPERFHLVQKMWEMLLSGSHTVEQIRLIANDEWKLQSRKTKKRPAKPLSRSGIYRLFNNVFYAGHYEYHGTLYKGNHQPMITMAEFEQVQLMLGSKGKPAAHTREFAYTGPINCGECGAQVTAEVKQYCVCSICKTKFSCINRKVCPSCDTDIVEMVKPVIRRYTYYRCTRHKTGLSCSQSAIQVGELERQLDSYLKTIHLNQKYLDWAIKHLKRAHQLESTQREVIQHSQQKAYVDAGRKLDRLLEMRMDEEINEDEYKAKKKLLIQDQAILEAELKETKERQHRWLELSERTFNFARYSRFWLADAGLTNDLQRKREILTTLGSHLTLKDKILHISAPEPFQILGQALQEIPEARAVETAPFAPLETPVFSNEGTREAVAEPVRPEWSG